MVVYYGVIKDHRVVLDDDVRLADGTRVEVRLQPAAPRDAVQGVVMAQSNIASMENVALGPFGTPPPKGKGSALVTPLSILERWPSPSPAATTRLKPELYALIVSLA